MTAPITLADIPEVFVTNGDVRALERLKDRSQTDLAIRILRDTAVALNACTQPEEITPVCERMRTRMMDILASTTGNDDLINILLGILNIACRRKSAIEKVLEKRRVVPLGSSEEGSRMPAAPQIASISVR